MRARGYGLLDIVFAASYAYLGFVVAPSRSTAFSVALVVVVALLGAAGVTLLVGSERAGRRTGVLACGVLLAFTATCLVLLVASSAFLFGVYGAVGRGLGMMALVAAALVVELFGLLPLFQLRFHLRR